MKIESSKTNIISFENTPKLEKPQISKENQKQQELPSKVSMAAIVNPEIPVTYKKISQIPIPNLDSPASVYMLSNGQKVVIVPKKGKFFIKTRFSVGSNNETKEQKGLSHFIEHNLYAGSKNLLPAEYEQKIKLLGADSNASTSRNYTEYYLSSYLLDDDTLEQCIKLNANLTQFPTFDNNYLQNEKGAVKSEIDIYRDDEESEMQNICLKNLFNIPYDFDDVTGTKAHIDSFNRQTLIDYYQKYYTPDNTTTLIIGEVDPDETIKTVAKYFNKKPVNNDSSTKNYPKMTPINTPIRKDFISKISPKSTIEIAMALPSDLTLEDEKRILMFVTMLNSSNSNFSKKMEDLNAHSSVALSLVNENKNQSIGALVVSVEVDEEDVEKTLKTIYEELNDAINKRTITNDEIEIYKTRKLKNIDKSDTRGDIIDFVESALFYNNSDYVSKYKQTIAQTNPNNFFDTLKRSIDFNKTSIVVNHSKNSTVEQIKNNYTIDSTKPKTIQKGEISFTSKKQIEQTLIDDMDLLKTHYLANNVRVNTLETSKEDNSIFLDFFSDAFQDTPKIQLQLLEEILNCGCSSMKKDEFEEYLHKNNLTTFVTVEKSGIRLHSDCEEKQMMQTMNLIKQIMFSPTFDENEFNKIKERYKKEFQNKEDSLITKETKYLFPNNSYTNEEVINIIENTSLDDIKRLYWHFMQNYSLEATFSGNFSKNPNLTNIIDANLMAFHPTKTFDKTKDYYTKTFKPNAQEKLITNPKETKQATVDMIFAHNKLKNIHDIAKAEVLKEILNDRLFEELRSKQGLVYGVCAMSETVNNLEEVILTTNITTDDADDSNASSKNIHNVLDAYKKQIESLKTSLVSEDELLAAKNALKTEILDARDDDFFNFLDNAYRSYSYLGKDENLEYIRAIDEITPNDIKNAAKFMFQHPPVIGVEASQKTLDEFNLAK